MELKVAKNRLKRLGLRQSFGHLGSHFFKRKGISPASMVVVQIHETKNCVPQLPPQVDVSVIKFLELST